MPTARRTPESRDGVGSLPVWCQVAFAARCARRARPHFLRRKPETTDERLSLLDAAIELAEAAAAAGEADLNTAARAADDAARVARGATDSGRAVAAATACGSAADAARAAAFAPTKPPAGSGEYTTHALTAAHAAARAGVDPDLLREDLAHLLVGAREFGLDYSSAVPPTLLAHPFRPPPAAGTGAVAVRFDADATRPTDVALVLEYLGACVRAAGGPGLLLLDGGGWPEPPPPEPPEPPPEGSAEPPPPPPEPAPLAPWPAGFTLCLAALSPAAAGWEVAVRLNAALTEHSPLFDRAEHLLGCAPPPIQPRTAAARTATERFTRYEVERANLFADAGGGAPVGAGPGEDTVVAVVATDDTATDVPSGERLKPGRLAKLREAAERHRKRIAEKLAVRQVQVVAGVGPEGVLRVLAARVKK